MKHFLRSIVSLIPAGAAGFIYRTLLKPAPLRRLANQALLLILPRTVTLSEGVIVLNQTDPVVSGALALGVYEPFELNVFRQVLKEGMVVLDIGANIGIYTLIAAGRVGQKGRVIACEPEPTNYALLTETIKQNNFVQVVLYQQALADHEGVMDLHLSSANKGKHSLVKTKKDSAEFTSSVQVVVRTGDSLLDEAHIQRVDVIKMDIEGAEPFALRGLANAIKSSELTLFIEFSPGALRASGFSPLDMLRDLENIGFTIYEIEESRKKITWVGDQETFVKKFSSAEYTNLVCTKGQRSKEIIQGLIS